MIHQSRGILLRLRPKVRIENQHYDLPQLIKDIDDPARDTDDILATGPNIHGDRLGLDIEMNSDRVTAGDDEVLLSSLLMQEHASEGHPMGKAGSLEYDWPLAIDPKDNQIGPRLPTSAIPPRTPSHAIDAVRLQCQTEMDGSSTSQQLVKDEKEIGTRPTLAMTQDPEDLGSVVAQDDESATGAELKQDNKPSSTGVGATL